MFVCASVDVCLSCVYDARMYVYVGNGIFSILYIVNHSRWKRFVVVEMTCNLLENIDGCMVVLCV